MAGSSREPGPLRLSSPSTTTMATTVEIRPKHELTDCSSSRMGGNRKRGGSRVLPKHDKMPIMLVKLRRRSGKKFSGSRMAIQMAFHVVAVNNSG